MDERDAWQIPCPRPLRFAQRVADGEYPKEITENSLEHNSVAQHIWYIYYLIAKRDKQMVHRQAWDTHQERVIELALKVESLEGHALRLGFVGRIVDRVARLLHPREAEDI